MCEETPIVVYCVGYALPISCCLAGVGLSCFGCYRYYNAACVRHPQRQAQLVEPQSLTRQQIIKRNTLKKKMMEAFKKTLKQTTSSNSKTDGKEISLKEMKDTCPICISEYNQDTTKEFIGLIKSCGHYFHFECIWEWLERKRDCPICREHCQLSENDLRGLSLQQALEIACDDIAVPGPSKVTAAIETQSNTSTLTSTGSLNGVVIMTTRPDINYVGMTGQENMGLDMDGDLVGEHVVSTENENVVINEQPKSVQKMSKMFEDMGKSAESTSSID